MNEIKTKYCKGCNRHLPEDKFRKVKREYKGKVYYGLHFRCNECSSAYQKEFRHKDIEYWRGYNKEANRKRRESPEIAEKERERARELYKVNGSAERKRNWRTNNKNKARAYTKKFYHKSKEIGGESWEKIETRRRRNYFAMKNNPVRYEAYLRKERAISKRLVENLDEKYIKHLLSQELGIKEVPMDLITLRKSIIQLSRTLKERKPQWNQ